MSTVKEIEQAVARLSPEDLKAFRAWFAQYEAQAWDAQFERDVAAGKLDDLGAEALRDVREGRATDL